MERGAATRGRVARQMVGAEAIEIKATIPDHQIRQALARFKLTANNDEERYIYFFDTPKLDLLGAGIIARARRVVGEDHDSTVKFRPINPAAVGQKWRRYPDFKIEADASETSLVKSASFSMPVLKGHIKRVAVGKKPISAIFTPAQMKFLQKVAGHSIDFSTLRVLGPLLAQRWRFEDPGCPWPVTAELWRRGDGERMMELSIKAKAAHAAVAVGGFMAFLAEVGAERDKDQQTKTRWALEYYIGKLGLAEQGGAKAAAKARPRPRAGKAAGRKASPTSASKRGAKRLPPRIVVRAAPDESPPRIAVAPKSPPRRARKVSRKRR